MSTNLNLTKTSSETSTGSILFQYSNKAQETEDDVILTYPSAATNYRISIATIPEGSKFHVGAHWHEKYDEVLRVIKGRARIMLGKTWKVYTADDGDIVVKRGVVHDFTRADTVGDERDEGDMVIEETTKPVDGSKELFFRNMFSVSNIDKDRFGWKLPLQMLLTLAFSDTYLSLVPEALGGRYFTYGMNWSVKRLGWLAGLSPFYDEYTPERLQAIKRKLEGGSERKRD